MNSIFNKLVQAEKEFQDSEFVAPIFSAMVAVNIAGITLKYRVLPANFQGWAILEPIGLKRARVVRDAPRHLKNQYLQTLPKFSFVICDVEKFLGINTNTDDRIQTLQPFPILLADNIGLFDTIIVRFDSANFWYDRHHRVSKKIADSLNNNLEKNIHYKNIKLHKGYKEAYEYCYYKKQLKLLGDKEYQIKLAIERAGGKYLSYKDSGENIRVSYKVDNQTYTSTLGKKLDVVSAGICLSGEDSIFDLQSLITVVREGQNKSVIHRY